MNQRALLLIALLAAAFVLYLSARQKETQPLPTEIQVENKYYMEDFVSSSFDQEGVLQRIVRGKNLKQSSHSEEITIEAPFIQLIDKESPDWIVTAQQAWLDAEQNHARLKGDVVAREQATDPTEIRTAELGLDFPHQTAATASSVSITQGPHSIEGKGLRANLPKGTLEILNEVRGLYAP